MKEQLRTWMQAHLPLLIGTGPGLLIGILMLTIGFFPTLLLLICGGIGALIGGIPVIRRLIMGWIERLIDKIFHKF